MLSARCSSLLLGFSFFAGMINYIQPGNAITAAAPYQRNTGQGTLLGGNLFGVAVDTVASGATGVFWTEGVFELTKLSGTAESFTLGKRVFWDDTNKRLTVVSTAERLRRRRDGSRGDRRGGGAHQALASTPAGT
jgi:predicted RecA/RadA family phage recombinase